MKKSVILLLAVLCLSGGLHAKPVDVETAKSLGVKFMNVNTSVKSAEAELTYTAIADNGMACCYVFAVHPKGFVIVSADDRMRPILGYSTESNFTAQLPDGLMTFFDNYKAGFSQMVGNNDVRTEQAVSDWTRLAETGRLNDTKIDRSVAPLLASIWNQTDLYNNMAPLDPSSVFSGHCKSGCVANAMSQVMRYWEWPRHGQGGHGYNANTQYGNYGWLQVNFEDATYHFELMPDFLDFASPQGEVDATALLEYHVGVSVDMSYGPNASGAYSQDVGRRFGSISVIPQTITTVAKATTRPLGRMTFVPTSMRGCRFIMPLRALMVVMPTCSTAMTTTTCSTSTGAGQALTMVITPSTAFT